jgi:hypothetical membrane protein
VRTRALLLGGVLGPLAFIAAWVGAGFAATDYSPVTDPISELAEVGAPTQAWMTAGFIVFGVGVAAFGVALRTVLPGLAGAAAIATGVCTLGVAAFPLGWNDSAHGAFAGAGYATLALTPAFAALRLRIDGQRRWALWSLAASVVIAAALVLSVVWTRHGLWQRIGLTTGDLWIIACATTVLARGSTALSAFSRARTGAGG